MTCFFQNPVVRWLDFGQKPLKGYSTSSQNWTAATQKKPFFIYLWNSAKLQFRTRFWKRAVRRGLSVKLCQSTTEASSIYFSPCLSFFIIFFALNVEGLWICTKSWKRRVNIAAADGFRVCTHKVAYAIAVSTLHMMLAFENGLANLIVVQMKACWSVHG